MKERNNNIDFLRGIAALCIIIIHTAFWSGTNYLPKWFYNLTLLIDVPAFMFISGITFNFTNSFEKSLKTILQIWKKWIFFILFFIIFALIFYNNIFTVKDIINWMVFLPPKGTILKVVQGSIWFIYMFIKVYLLCNLIIIFVNKNKNKDILYKLIIGIFILIFLMSSLFNETYILDRTISFYSILYLIGYISKDIKIKNISKLLILEVITIITTISLFLIFELDITQIQNTKFPTSICYLSFSFISIFLFWYLKDNMNIKNNIITYFGKNALFLFFAQGISSSLLFLIIPNIGISNIWIKFIILLLINYLICIILSYIMIELYKLKEKYFNIDYNKIKNYFFEKK